VHRLLTALGLLLLVAAPDASAATDTKPPLLSGLKKIAADMKPGEWRQIDRAACRKFGVKCPGPLNLSAVFKDKADYPRSVWGAVGPRAIVSAWASGVWDGRRLYLSNGGHRDYFGNDVLAWDAEWLRFVRVTNPSPLIDFGKKTCRPETGPPSAHTYDGALWVPALQEAWFPGRFSNCGHFANFWAFDPEIRRWRQTKVPAIGWGGSALHPSGRILVATGPSSCQVRFRVIDPVKETMTEMPSGQARGCQSVAAVSGGYFWVIGTYGDPNQIRITATRLTGKGLTLTGQLVSEPVGIHVGGTGMTAGPDGGVMLWAGQRNTMSATVENGRIVLRHFANRSGPAPRMDEVRAGVFGRWQYVADAGVFIGLNHHTRNGVWLYRPPTTAQAETPKPLPRQLSTLLRNVPPGGTLALKRGDYYGTLIKKPVTIKNEPGARILGFGQKGALQIAATPVTIDGCEIRNSRAAMNSSGIWGEVGMKVLTIRNSRFFNNGNGLLIGRFPGVVITIEDTVFERQGAGGQAHQIYASGTDIELIIRRSTFRHTTGEGHVIKTGAKRTLIEDTKILGSPALYSRAIDAFAGGHVSLKNVTIEHGPKANHDIISFGPEMHRAKWRKQHSISFQDVKVKCLNSRPCKLIHSWLPIQEKITGVTVTGGRVDLKPVRR
jgi:hypothetical protein